MSLLILAHGASWDRRFQISSLAASAAAGGASSEDGPAVEIALFFGALDAWVRGRWDELDPDPPVARDHLESLAFPPLSELLEPGRRSGAIRLYACSASVRFLDLDLRKVQEKVDAILGWQTFAQKIADRDRTVTF